MTTKLFLIRHPQTDYSLEKRYCGITDRPLSGVGISQAQKLADYFRGLAVDTVYTSPLERAREAAKIIFGKTAEHVVAESLQELNFGSWEGMTYEEILGKYPKEHKRWIGDPLITAPPNGERLLDLRGRTAGFMKRTLQKDEGKTIAIISHNGPVRIILCEALNLGLRNFWNLRVDWASLNYLEYKDDAIVNFSLNIVEGAG